MLIDAYAKGLEEGWEKANKMTDSKPKSVADDSKFMELFSKSTLTYFAAGGRSDLHTDDDFVIDDSKLFDHIDEIIAKARAEGMERERERWWKKAITLEIREVDNRDVVTWRCHICKMRWSKNEAEHHHSDCPAHVVPVDEGG